MKNNRKGKVEANSDRYNLNCIFGLHIIDISKPFAYPTASASAASSESGSEESGSSSLRGGMTPSASTTTSFISSESNFTVKKPPSISDRRENVTNQ